MRVAALPEILVALDEDDAIAAIENGFRRFARGEAMITPVGHLEFPQAPGDCHIKSAHIAGDDTFVVKVATGFYANPRLGLESSNGFMALMSARTGEMLCLLHDRGRLTDQRTAMAGTIAARLIARPGSSTLGIVGAGIQARLQGEMIARRLGLPDILVHARNPKAGETLAANLGGRTADLATLCDHADLIVTTTPARAPIIDDALVRPGTRIVAVGADTPGKQELDARILGRARVVVDSVDQCVDHGETGWAVRAGLLDPAALLSLGDLLNAPIAFAEDEIIVADLTGVAIQDHAIANSVWRAMERC